MNPGGFVALVVLVAGVADIIVARWLGDKSRWRDSDVPLLMMIIGIGLLFFSLPTALFIGALVHWLP